jgi:hypothetical protein
LDENWVFLDTYEFRNIILQNCCFAIRAAAAGPLGNAILFSTEDLVMKFPASAFLLLVSMNAFPQAQTFQHIIVVVQEDNLFGSNPTFEAGVNLKKRSRRTGPAIGYLF